MSSRYTTLILLCLSLVCLCTALICPAIDFNADADVEFLGEFSNSHYITNVLTRRSGEQRVEIAKAYKKKYKRDFYKSFNRFTNNYENLLVAMVTPLSDYYAKELYRDSGVFGFNSHATVDILTTSANVITKAINESFMRVVPHSRISLADHLYLRNKGLPNIVVYGQLAGVRNETQKVFEDELNADAKVLWEYGQQMNTYSRNWYHHERPIKEIFLKRSFKHLHQLIQKYENLYGYKIEKAFERWSFDDFPQGAINMIDVLKSVPNYFVSRLDNITHSWLPHHNRQLIRIIVGRSEIDLDDIKDAFQKKFSQSLSERIEETKSLGEYRRTLLAIVNSKCSYQYC